MKRAPLAFLAALALFLAALAGSQRAEPPHTRVPLDLDGVDTVVVEAEGRVVVTLGAGVAPQASHRSDDAATLDVQRGPGTLNLRYRTEGYTPLTVDLPASVRRLVVDGGSVNAKATPPVFEIRSSDGLAWTGNIARLQLVDTAPYPRCQPNCGVRLRISEGTIGELEATTWGGEVHLADADRIGAATLRLGPTATLSLGKARRLGQLRIVELDERP